jgi:hypothetical protein
VSCKPEKSAPPPKKKNQFFRDFPDTSVVALILVGNLKQRLIKKQCEVLKNANCRSK